MNNFVFSYLPDSTNKKLSKQFDELVFQGLVSSFTSKTKLNTECNSTERSKKGILVLFKFFKIYFVSSFAYLNASVVVFFSMAKNSNI